MSTHTSILLVRVGSRYYLGGKQLQCACYRFDDPDLQNLHCGKLTSLTIWILCKREVSCNSSTISLVESTIVPWKKRDQGGQLKGSNLWVVLRLSFSGHGHSFDRLVCVECFSIVSLALARVWMTSLLSQKLPQTVISPTATDHNHTD